jgi:hypothetical protein
VFIDMNTMIFRCKIRAVPGLIVISD